MKRCPECRRDYTDETLNFCLDDGTRLVDGPAADESATVILSEPGTGETGIPPSESPTVQLQTPVTVDGSGRSKRKLLAVAIIPIVLVIAGVGFAVYKFWARTDKPLRVMKIERLTTNSKSSAAAISPDGKYVVYSVDEGGQHSLWVRHVAASSNIQIIPPAEDVYYWGLTFTPDSSYINFVKVQFEKNVAWPLYQISVLGGTQKKLTAHAEGGVSYSPDGKQFAFVREEYPTAEESSILIANADGTEERILASRKTPESFPSRQTAPAWSPDGKTIACIVNDETKGVGRSHVVEVNVADGTSETIVTKEWEDIFQIAWLPNKSGLLVLGIVKGGDNYAGQIWRFSYPEGEARRITTDLNNYSSLSLTSDSNAL